MDNTKSYTYPDPTTAYDGWSFPYKCKGSESAVEAGGAVEAGSAVVEPYNQKNAVNTAVQTWINSIGPNYANTTGSVPYAFPRRVDTAPYWSSVLSAAMNIPTNMAPQSTIIPYHTSRMPAAMSPSASPGPFPGTKFLEAPYAYCLQGKGPNRQYFHGKGIQWELDHGNSGKPARKACSNCVWRGLECRVFVDGYDGRWSVPGTHRGDYTKSCAYCAKNKQTCGVER
ncbi:hypothetical protein M501DRAFT_997394 [Patellaria atrata CBS 101060]|uniref:Uncharacterized protein n=1 Tax=Patellaria atrata CBS 101060 TaxID=1346257 RepID=A0A9P4VQ40_9PEZI|nr:hypothetical protein M501DRAFT_997394 [Patellaria atrata CBS 101060]